MDDPKRGLTIHFIDGSKVSYTFTKATDDPAAMKMRLAEILKGQYLMIAADGVLTTFPIVNIKAIQLPIDGNEEAAALPSTVIRSATLTRGDL
jgi:hypothetical protein